MPQIVIKLGENVVQNFSFDKDIVNVGRSRDNDITIDNLAVSRSHCRIRHVDGKFILTDLNSANGTFVNGVKVTKTELMDRDVVSVGKHNLIFELNSVNEEEAIGEAFGANRTMIVENTAEGILRIAKGKGKGQEFRITKYETTLGRAPENDVVINDWFVSKAHAKILRQGSNYVLKDLGSWKGTYINETQVKEPTNLREGDEIRMGSTKLIFSLFDEKKQLQVEMRRPQELSYDDSGDRMPPPIATAAAAPSSPSHQVVRREPEAATESPLPPPLPRKGQTAESLGSPDHITRDGVPKPAVPEAGDDELNFDDLPEPTLMDTNIAAAMEKMRAEAAAGPASPAAAKPAPRPVPPPVAAAPAASWQDFSSSSTAAPAANRSPATPSQASLPDASSPALDILGSDDPDRMAKQIAMWEKALQNKSPLIRKQAAKMLKKLTGKDYEV